MNNNNEKKSNRAKALKEIESLRSSVSLNRFYGQVIFYGGDEVRSYEELNNVQLQNLIWWLKQAR